MSDGARVGILGATGHIGRALAVELASSCSLTLYARRPAAALEFARSQRLDPLPAVRGLTELDSVEHDALVNCIGLGDPAAVSNKESFDSVTRWADELAIEYLRRYPSARLVNMSSGAAYCSDFRSPARGGDLPDLRTGASATCDAYSCAKRDSEIRHRREQDVAIVDLRVFGFFSRYISEEASYFMSAVLRALRAGSTLVTNASDFMRDYVAPRDLARLVRFCVDADPVNTAFDVYSASPVSKFEVLDEFVHRFGLTYSVEKMGAQRDGKSAYYSLDRSARLLGYEPTLTSLEVLTGETNEILKAKK